MPIHDFSLRELKFGSNRIKIMKELLDRLINQSINDIYVEDLCKAVGISKVTFFHYFHSKEEIVYYFILGWEYARSYEAVHGLFHGRSGIEHIFESIGREPFSENIMLSLAQYLSKADSHAFPTTLTKYEYSLFHAQAYEENIQPMNTMEIMSHYMRELALPPGKSDDICMMLLTILYGTPLVSKCSGGNYLKELYLKNIGLLFNAIEGCE